MGLAASQSRYCMLTSRKDDVEGSLLRVANKRLELSRDSERISHEYTDALNATKLTYNNGTKDVDVSPQDAISAYNDMKNLGGNVELINAGNYDHTASLIHSLPEIQRWFNNTR